MQSIWFYISNSLSLLSSICATIFVVTDSFSQIVASPVPLTSPSDSLGVFVHVPRMPKAFGCHKIEGTEAEQNACTKARLLSFFKTHLTYPELAIKEGIEGRIPVSFIVEKDGYISQVELQKHLGGGCYQEAKRLLVLLRKHCQFTPLSARGRPLRIKFRTEIVFSLDH
ncbi:MAG: energy transducer TonB [Saprospiraceae bacterium]|nr:energy transducer TonB [Saprospiraceae bacterium]